VSICHVRAHAGTNAQAKWHALTRDVSRRGSPIRVDTEEVTSSILVSPTTPRDPLTSQDRGSSSFLGPIRAAA
jgi:hypothetical protein